MRAEPNIIITGTPGVGKTIHGDLLARNTGLKHVQINQVAKDNNCFDGYDEALQCDIVDEDKVLDVLEDSASKGGLIIDHHGCDYFPESWIDLVVVLQCKNTELYYDRLAKRGYSGRKLQENLDCEIMEVLLSEARGAYEENLVIAMKSEVADDVTDNVSRIEMWREQWKEANLQPDEEEAEEKTGDDVMKDVGSGENKTMSERSENGNVRGEPSG